MLFNKILNKDKKPFWIFFTILFILTLLMLYSFMPSDKINPGHDMLFHHRRILALMEALKNGSFPIYLDYEAFDNYGYGTKWFYPDLILIPFAYIANITDFVFAYKLMWFIMTILCGMLTYKMVNRIYKNTTAAAFSALLYTFSTYRLQDIYERASVGEALSFTFLPLVFLGLYEIIKGDYKKWYIIVIGFSFLICSHLLSSVLTFITVFIFICIYYKDFIKQPKRIYTLFLAGITTLILCSYFVLPFLEQILNSSFQINKIKYEPNSESKILESLRSIFYPHSIFVKEKFEPYMGITMLICILLRLFVRDKSKYTKSIDTIVIIGIVYFLLTINIFNWNNYPLKLINFIQYPWRLYEFCTFFFSIAGGYYLSKILKPNNKSLIISLCIVAIIAGLIITQSSRYKIISRYYTAITNTPVMTMERFYWYFVSLEYFPENLTIDIVTQKGQNIDSSNKSTVISNVKRKSGYISCDVQSNTGSVIEFPLTYYKGYSATLDDKKIEVTESKNGLVEVPINNSGKLVVEFSGTPIQRYSLYITLISCILLIIYILINRKKENEYQ